MLYCSDADGAPRPETASLQPPSRSGTRARPPTAHPAHPCFAGSAPTPPRLHCTQLPQTRGSPTVSKTVSNAHARAPHSRPHCAARHSPPRLRAASPVAAVSSGPPPPPGTTDALAAEGCSPHPNGVSPLPQQRFPEVLGMGVGMGVGNPRRNPSRKDKQVPLYMAHLYSHLLKQVDVVEPKSTSSPAGFGSRPGPLPLWLPHGSGFP
jgi:hypothetical protein